MALPKNASLQAPKHSPHAEAASPRAIERVPILISLAFGILALVAISVLTHGRQPAALEPSGRPAGLFRARP